LLRSGESEKSRDWVAVLRGCSERVSAIQFNRENTGNFVEIMPSGGAEGQHSQGIAGEIPYTRNREIFEANRVCL
jgi:hypothetical protein